MQVASEDGIASGVIVEQLQKGYILKDKVIRPSMVKVTE
jgi:molecular chaperone GrpE